MRRAFAALWLPSAGGRHGDAAGAAFDLDVVAPGGIRVAGRLQPPDVAHGIERLIAEGEVGGPAFDAKADLDARRAALEGGPASAAIDPRFALRLLTAEEELAGRGAGAIRFFPDGTSTGGRLRISLGERAYEVRVDWITGAVALAQ